MNALEALNDQLYTSCTSCISTIAELRAAARRRTRPAQPHLVAPSAAGALIHRLRRPLRAAPPASPPRRIVGRWRLLSAEDLRADGSVARHPWGQHPVGSIVVERGRATADHVERQAIVFRRAGPTARSSRMKKTLSARTLRTRVRASLTRPLEA